MNENTVKAYMSYVEAGNTYLSWKSRADRLERNIDDLEIKIDKQNQIMKSKDSSFGAKEIAQNFLTIMRTDLALLKHDLIISVDSMVDALKAARQAHQLLVKTAGIRRISSNGNTSEVSVTLPYHTKSKVYLYDPNDSKVRITAVTRHLIAGKGRALVFGSLLPGLDWPY